MSLTRRHANQPATEPGRERRGSLWEDEADEYWKKMEPAKRCRRITNYLGALVLFVLLGGGVFIGARTAMDREVIAAFKARFAPLAPPAANSTVPVATPPTPQTAAAPVPANSNTVDLQTLQRDPSALELLRSRCRMRGVQSRWHEETCRNLCSRDPHNPACMAGCSYGSLTVTKLACDKLPAADIPTATNCPDGVSCIDACRAYDDEAPAPDLRNACVRGCSNIVPSACARSLQIYKDLLRGKLQ